MNFHKKNKRTVTYHIRTDTEASDTLVAAKLILVENNGSTSNELNKDKSFLWVVSEHRGHRGHLHVECGACANDRVITHHRLFVVETSWCEALGWSGPRSFLEHHQFVKTGLFPCLDSPRRRGRHS